MSDDVDLNRMPKQVREQYERSVEMMRKPEEPEQTPPQAEQPPKPEEHQQTQKPDVAEWQHKYSVLQGKYNAEVPRLHQQTKSLEAQVANLAAELERIKNAKSQEPQGAIRELMEVLGDDDPQLKLAKEQQDRIYQLEGLIAKMEAQLGGVAQTQQLTAEDRFYAAIERVVPDWQAVNLDPGLLLWLAEYDPILGSTRKEAFDDAAARLDAARVSAFFDAYKRSTAKPVAAPKADKPSSRLASQVVPASGGGNTSPEEGAGKTWTRESVKKFFDDCVKGVHSLDEQERIKREILIANAEGRIVG